MATRAGGNRRSGLDFAPISLRFHAGFIVRRQAGGMTPPSAVARQLRSVAVVGGGTRVSRRRWVLALFAAACGAGAYARWIEPFFTETVRCPLPVTGLPEALRGARIVQLSDLHISHRVSEAYLRSACERIADWRPEIVVHTGDFLTLGPDTETRLARMFPRLPRGQWATLGVLGNHDYGERWREPHWAERVVRLGAESGIEILRNEIADVRGLQVVGLDDLWAGRCDPARTLRRLDRHAASIVLSHNPDSVDAGDWCGFRGWVLAGHTHGGQCKPPFLPAPLLPVKNRRYRAGRVALADGRTLYINRGLGYLHQVRFNVRPEITVFTLVPA